MKDLVALEAPGWGLTVCQGLHELYREKIGFSVAIYGSDGGILDAHACILMAVSPTLKVWLAGDPIQGCHSVEIDSITCEVWTQLLDFIYTGKISATRKQLSGILAAADKLQMQVLAQVCREALGPKSHDLPPLIKNNSTDTPYMKVTGDHTDVIKRSIRSTITPIQPAQDKLRNNDEMPSKASDLPPLVSLHKNTAPERKIETASSTETRSERKEGCDLPLDLTKDLSRPSNMAAPTAPVVLNTQNALSPPTGPTPQMGQASQMGGGDPQMQALMAVYYNQMLQYSMLAQNMQHGGNSAGNGAFPGVPSSMPGSMPPKSLPTAMMQSMLGGSPFMPAMAPEDGNSSDGRQRKFACGICGMLFFTRHVKEQHELTHTNLKPYGCNICGFRARQKAVIWRHKKNRHPEADNSVSMDALMLPPSGASSFGPGETEEEEEADGDINGEEEDGPSRAKQDNRCIVPKSEAIEENGALSLALKTTQEKRENPDQKPMTFDDSKSPLPVTPEHRGLSGVPDGSSLTDIEHEVQAAPRTEDGFLCRLCGRHLKSKIILQEHLLTHYNIRRYSCCYCNYRAKQRAGLYNHMKVKHKGMRPIWPGKTHPTVTRSPFQRGSPSVKERLNRSFYERKQTHTFHVGMARKHLCRTCGKSFRMKSTLEKHELIHMNIKRYSCKYCGYKSKRKSLIVEHTAEKHNSMQVRIADLYSNRCSSPSDLNTSHSSCMTNTSESDASPEVKDLSQKNTWPKNLNMSSVANGLKSSYDIPTPSSLGLSMLQPPSITRDSTGMISPISFPTSGLAGLYDTRMHSKQTGIGSEGSKMTMLNGSVGIVQLEMPKSEMASGAQVNFSSYGTPDKPHRCKTCGRCFRLRHVMEQHELTHFNFRKYMCDICGFRAKQKAVIYRHKKVKHPNHPGAGRVTLVPEYGVPFGQPSCSQQSVLNASSIALSLSPFMGMHVQSLMKPMTNMPGAEISPPNMRQSPYKLSPTSNPKLLHNNNKRSPQQDVNAVQDLSLPTKIKREEDSHDDGVMDMRVSPFKVSQNSTLVPTTSFGGILPKPSFSNNCFNSVISQSNQQRPLDFMNTGSNHVGDNCRIEDDEDENSTSSLKSCDNLNKNMSMGLPSMVPSSQAPFMSLPPIAPLSPEGQSTSPLGGSTPDKKYPCQVCGRCFKHRHVLDQHYITHTGLRPYKCEFCDFCARQKASLWRHKQKHLGHQHQQQLA